MGQLVKTVNGLAIASVKTVNGLAIASVKTINGLDNTSSGAWYDSIALSGLSSDNSSSATIIFQAITTTPTGTATKLRVYNLLGATSAGLKCAIYTISGTDFTRVSDVGTAATGSGNNAYTEVTISNYSTTAGTYYVGFLAETTADYKFAYITGSAPRARYQTGQDYVTGPPASVSSTSDAGVNYAAGVFVQ